MPKRFGQNLSTAIDEAGLTNHEVAVRAGLTETEVSYYRNARRNPGVDKAAALARAVGKSLDELANTPTPEERAAAFLAEKVQDLQSAKASRGPRSRGS